MGLVVDTSALVALERDSIEALSDLPVQEILTIPAIVWAEVMIGVLLADSPARAARRRDLMERVKQALGIKPFTAEVAEHYASIHACLARAGTMIPSNDIAVAATAQSLGFGVLVGPRDETHFRLVPNLAVSVLARKV
jgi:predicted nucleic acid-binding protein